jgi:hypothetical protein
MSSSLPLAEVKAAGRGTAAPLRYVHSSQK